MKLARRFIASNEGFLEQIFAISESFRRHPVQLIALRLGCSSINASRRLSSIICLYNDKFRRGQQDISIEFHHLHTEETRPISPRSRNCRMCILLSVSFTSQHSISKSQSSIQAQRKIEEAKHSREKIFSWNDRKRKRIHRKLPISQAGRRVVHDSQQEILQ